MSRGIFGRFYNVTRSAFGADPSEFGPAKKAIKVAIQNANRSPKKEVRELQLAELKDLIAEKAASLKGHPVANSVLAHARAAVDVHSNGGDAKDLIAAAVKEVEAKELGIHSNALDSVVIPGSQTPTGSDNALSLKVRAVELAKSVTAGTLPVATAIRRLSVEISSGEMAEIAVAEAFAAMEAARLYVTELSLEGRAQDRTQDARMAVAKIESQEALNRALTRGSTSAVMALKVEDKVNKVEEKLDKAAARAEAVLSKVESFAATANTLAEALGKEGEDGAPSNVEKFMKNINDLLEGFNNGKVEVSKQQV